jgi:7,8-dihydro-6-hydroxymethylpterin-pyrophosphokinase
VLFEAQQVTDDDLTVPHPGLADRDFWQRELSQIRGER